MEKKPSSIQHKHFFLSFFNYRFFYRVRQITFKKTAEYFLKFLFYLKVQFFRLIMENNFIQTAALAGHAVAYTIGPIFKHITDCVPNYVLTHKKINL